MTITLQTLDTTNKGIFFTSHSRVCLLWDTDLCIADILSLQVYVEHSCHPETEAEHSNSLLCFI